MILSYCETMNSGERHQTGATFTTDHSASSYGIPVLVLDDGGPIDHLSWHLFDYQVEEATDNERRQLEAWFDQLVA